MILSDYSKRTNLTIFISRIILLIILIFHWQPATFAQQPYSKRPKIGLALSGGGSCGIAHLGVLKVMEEAGLRPDVITGVSMGSIIGGFYATGYSTDSLISLFKHTDWDLLISNRIPEYKIIFPEKKHFYNSLVAVPLTFKKSILPRGLINGQQIENMLSYYGWPAALISDFSKLPIPFLCLATNLVTCKKTELRHGYLPDAMRASFAVPTIFTPIKIDSLLLVDGGMIRNLAVSEAREIGANYVIGSYTGSHLSTENQLKSVTDIITQLGFFIGVYDFQEQRKFANIIIEPYTDDLSSTSFSNIDTIIQRGYKAALPYKKKFKRLADSLNKFGPQLPIKYILDRQYYTFDRIQINGNKKISGKQILGVLNIKPGQRIDKKMLKDKIDLLYGKAWFDKVKYRIVPENDSIILNIDCIEQSKAMFYGSIHYDDALHSGLVVGISVRDPLMQRSDLEINTYIGNYYILSADYYQYIDHNQKYGISLNFYAENTLLPMLKFRDETGNMFGRNLYTGFTLVKRFGLNHLMNLYGRYEILNLVPDYITDENLTLLSGKYITMGYEYKMNTLDNENFPNNGAVLNFSLSTSKMLSSSEIRNSVRTTFTEENNYGLEFKRFYTLRTGFRQYFSKGKKFTFSLNGDLLYVTNSDSISSRNNFWLLGGITSSSIHSIPMPGFHSNQIQVRKMAGLGFDADYEIATNFHLDLFAGFSAINDEESDKGRSFLAGYGIGAGYMSVLGPLRIGLMHGLYRNEKYFSEIKGYISLGFSF